MSADACIHEVKRTAAGFGFELLQFEQEPIVLVCDHSAHKSTRDSIHTYERTSNSASDTAPDTQHTRTNLLAERMTARSAACGLDESEAYDDAKAVNSLQAHALTHMAIQAHAIRVSAS